MCCPVQPRDDLDLMGPGRARVFHKQTGVSASAWPLTSCVILTPWLGDPSSVGCVALGKLPNLSGPQSYLCLCVCSVASDSL